MPWYAYHRGGWQIAVDAMNKADADALKRREFAGAEFDGEFTPVSMANGWSAASAFVTPRREAQIHERFVAEQERARREWPYLFEKKEPTDE